MSIIPKNKALELAIQWISEERQARPEEKLFGLVSEASQRFDLSPMEGESLFTTLLAEANAIKSRGGEK